MLHVVVGIVAIVIGLLGLMGNWYMFKDILFAIVPIVVLFFGIIAVLAGIRKMKANWAAKEASEKEA